MNYPQLVSNLTQEQGIGIAGVNQSIESSGLEFCQYAGSRINCELFDNNECSRDGLLWGSNDMGSPYFCTNHTYPMENLGHEFVELSGVGAN